MPESKFSHKKYYIEPNNQKMISKYNIRTGMIITFPYSAYDKKPLVFVMDTQEIGKSDEKSFSGINLNYLPIKEINKFFIKALNKMSWENDKRTKFPRGRLLDDEVAGLRPITLYQSLIKRTLLQKRNCWRTYKYNKIKTAMQIKFKFEEPPLNQIWQDGFQQLNKISKDEMYKKLKGDKPKTITFEQPDFTNQWDSISIHEEFKYGFTNRYKI